jgi:hypothetical protein
MEYFVGISLALAVSLFGALVGLDRDRAFYPVVLVVVASYYALFAVMSGSALVLGLELAAASVFILATILGFRTNLWLVAAALVGHGLFDFVHSGLIANSSVPAWWPNFCMSYDVVAGLCLAWLLGRSALSARTTISLAAPPTGQNS